MTALRIAALAVALATATDPGVEREWRIRRWASDVERAAPELERALRADDWLERHAALEALVRGAGPAGPGAPARAASVLDDPHPNVRASALVALRRTGRVAPPAAALGRLAADRLPEVRLELARTLGALGDATTDALLLELAHDPDPGVADTARRALVARGAPAAEAQLALLGRLWAEGDDEAWLTLALLVARSGEPTSLVDGLAQDVAEAGAPEPGAAGRRARSRGSVVEALRILRGADAEPATLVAGWLDRLDTGDAPERRRRELLLRAARRAGPPAGERLVARLGAAGHDDDATGFLIEGALEASGPNAVVRAALRLDLAAGTAVDLWQRVATRATARPLAWRPEAAEPWLAPARPAEVREAAAEALALGFAAHGDDAAGELLVGLLDDERRLRAMAVSALTDAPDPARWLGALHADWVGRGAAEQQALLNRLTRAVPATPFRDDLLRLGDSAAALAVRSPSLIELCGGFAGDDEVAAALGRWLAEDLATLARHAGAGGAAWSARERRPYELRAQGLVRALLAAGGEDAVPALRAALEESLRADTLEVAKVCVAALGRTERGRRQLPSWIGDDAPGRVAIEAALWIGDEAPSPARIRARTLLIQRYPTCDGELRARILRKAGEATDSNTLVFLAQVATSDLPLEERGLALSSLGRRRHATVALATLAGVVDDLAADRGELETLRRAIEAVGALGGDEARALLATLRSRLVDGEGQAATFDRGARELLSEELLLAQVRVGDVAPDVARELCARPLAGAEAEPLRRFEGRRGTSTEFAYRAELELCGRLALEGGLGAALADRPLERLDARLCLALAERALDGAALARAAAERSSGARRALAEDALRDTLAAARALLGAAEVGFPGEALDDEGRALRVRVRVRLALLARARRSWGEAEARLAQLLHDWRTGRVGERDLRDALGPEARSPEAVRALFESALEQARAWLALERGELERARRHAARARERAGGAASTWEGQRRLEAALAR